MEQQRTFSIIEALKYGFNIFYNHFFLLIGARLGFQAILEGLPFCAYALIPSLEHAYTKLQTKISTGFDWAYLFSQHTIFLIMAVFIYYILISVVLFGLIQIDLDIYDIGSSSLSRLFSWISRADKTVTVVVCLLFPFSGLIFIAGLEGISKPFLLFFYWLAIYYCFTRCLLATGCLIDQEDSVYRAFVRSWNVSSGNVLRIGILLEFSGILRNSISWLIPHLFLYIRLQSFETVINIIGKELISIMISQSLVYAYRQLSPAESNCRETKKECEGVEVVHLA